MTRDPAKLIVGLAAALGTALLVFARRNGSDVELPELSLDADPVDRAELELQRWEGLKETDARAAPLLARYWKAVGLPPQPSDTPWSAAFLSFVARPALDPSGDHVGYARAALRARKSGTPNKYWAFAPNESGVLPVRRGDILIRGRGQPVSWQDVETDTGHKDAHGDLVTDVSAGVVSLIGGNVSNAVTQTDQLLGAAPVGVFAILRKPPAVGGQV